MGIVEEVEDFLKEEINKRIEGAPHPFRSIPSYITERPLVKYKPDCKWYRRCSRCNFFQTPDYLIGFPETFHSCRRDDQTIHILWERRPW